MVERRAFACPSCNARALAETEESAICSRCDIRFSTSEPALTQGLVLLPVQRGLMPLRRRLALCIAYIVAATAFGGWYAGAIGAASSAVLMIGLSSMYVAADLVRDIIREHRAG